MTGSNYGKATVKLITDLTARGINKMSVIMRHSARHYDYENPHYEPFLSLTDEGKAFSYDLGNALPDGLVVHPLSSTFGRCIETAYLIDKGYTAKGGQTFDNQVARPLSPSFVKNPYELSLIMKQIQTDFIRYWFEGNISTDIMEAPPKAAWEIVNFLKDALADLQENHINLAVSHDWNMYLIKEHLLGLPHESAGKVEYLEGAVVYKEQGELFLANHQSAPRPLGVN